MNNTVPIVRKLQIDAINQDVRVSALLRTAKVVATKLNLPDALMWIDRELDGYMDLPVEELPRYRRLRGDLKGFNPYHGWRPIQFENPDTERILSQAPIGISIGTIEEQIKKQGKGRLIFDISPENKNIISNALEYPTEVQLWLSDGAIFGIVFTVILVPGIVQNFITQLF